MARRSVVRFFDDVTGVEVDPGDFLMPAPPREWGDPPAWTVGRSDL